MNAEIKHLIKSYKSAYEGDPWFGRSVKKILAEIDSDMAMQKPNDQHSILELLYHMVIWREFTISRLQPEAGKTSNYFGKNDWQKLDHADKTLWKKGLKQLDATQKKIIELVQKLDANVLTDQVAERQYNVRYLLHGILQHDIYHLGQIAYVKKMLE